MTIGRCPRALAALVIVLATTGPVVAQTATSVRATTDAARETALRSLAARLDLPLVDEAVAIFSTQLRRTLPATLVKTIGDNLGLGAQWRPGDAGFDETLRQTETALAREEARSGPLVRLERDDLLLAVNVPWTEEDIRFVAGVLPTPLGQEAQRAIDALLARQTIATLERRMAPETSGDAIRRSFADLDVRAQAQLDDASLMLLALKGSAPVTATRLQQLLAQVTVLPSDAIGQRLALRLSERLTSAAVNALPQLLQEIAQPRGLR